MNSSLDIPTHPDCAAAATPMPDLPLPVLTIKAAAPHLRVRILADWLGQGLERGTYGRLNDDRRYGLRVVVMLLHDAMDAVPEPVVGKRRWWRRLPLCR